jgi:hypothetical protein
MKESLYGSTMKISSILDRSVLRYVLGRRKEDRQYLESWKGFLI